MKPEVSPSFKASNFHEEQSDMIRGSRLGPVAGKAMGSVPSPQTPRQLPLPKSLTSSRGCLLGWAPRSPSMGTASPGLRAHTPARARCRHSHKPTHLSQGGSCTRQLRPGAAGTRPAERSQERSPRVSSLQEELGGRKPGVEGFGLHTCNSWMSQK